MKNTAMIALLGAAIMAATLISGCSSSGYTRGSSTSAGMEKTSKGLDAIVAQTDSTLTLLSNLVYNPTGDLVPQYKSFESATRKLASLSETVDGYAMQMQQRATAYFDEWDTGATNISNPDLRMISERRKAEVNQSFEKAANSLRKSKAAFDPFLSDVRDIQQMLNLDLTLGGIKSVTPTAKRAIAHGQDLKEAIAEAATDIRSLATRISPQIAPPAQ